MKKEDIITTLVYCLIMVITMTILFFLNMPTLFSITLFGFIFFAAFSNILKKFFVVKKKVNYKEFNFDNDFLDRPFKPVDSHTIYLKNKCRIYYILSMFGIVIGIGLVVIANFLLEDGLLKFIITIILLFLMLLVPLWRKYYKAYYEKLENQYKTEIECMFLYYLPSLTYSPFTGISESDYRFASFEHFDLFESEDQIYGRLTDRNFVISEVTTYLRHEDDNGNVSYSVNFQGTCGIINILPPINSFIYLVTPGFGLDIGGFKVDTDNYEFNANYDIFTNNEFLSLQLLTPSYMNKILDFRKKFGVYVEVKVHYDVVFFRFHTCNLFAPTLFNQKNENKNFAYYFQLIKEIEELMKETVEVLDKLSPFN